MDNLQLLATRFVLLGPHHKPRRVAASLAKIFKKKKKNKAKLIDSLLDNLILVIQQYKPQIPAGQPLGYGKLPWLSVNFRFTKKMYEIYCTFFVCIFRLLTHWKKNIRKEIIDHFRSGLSMKNYKRLHCNVCSKLRFRLS